MIKTSRKILLYASVSGLTGVLAGAFGSHLFANKISPEQLHTFETGVLFHFFHTFALIFTGLLLNKFPGRKLKTASYSFILGIMLFSFGIYAITLDKWLHFGISSFISPLIPFGGLLFLAGWLFLIIHLSSIRRFDHG